MRVPYLATIVAPGLLFPIAAMAAETKPKATPRAPAANSPAANPPGDAAKAPADRNAGVNGKKTETAVFAGGCFWCTEYSFEQITGVMDVQSGYCGGTKSTANYDRVHLGTTAHAEAIRVTYDPDKVSYEDLLEVFFDAHNPTQLNRQGDDDIGRQYRSAIFFANEDQKKQAEAKITELEEKRVFKRKIMTKLEPLTEFFPAEDYHQDFARRNPYLPYIQSHALPKAMNVRSKHPDLIRKPDQQRAD